MPLLRKTRLVKAFFMGDYWGNQNTPIFRWKDFFILKTEKTSFLEPKFQRILSAFYFKLLHFIKY